MKKSYVWIYYLIINLAFLSVVGYFTYKIFYPDKPVYPDPVILFEQSLVVGTDIKVVDPEVVDYDDALSTYSFTLTNNSEDVKIYYLYLNPADNQLLADALTYKIKTFESDQLISYPPVGPIRKISLEPNQSQVIYLKLYLDITQTIDVLAFQQQSITVIISDDYASYYNLKVEKDDLLIPDDSMILPGKTQP